MSALYGFIGGAIGGAVGGLIGWGLTALIWPHKEPADRPKWLATVCFVIMIAATRPIANSWSKPSLDEELIKTEEAYPALAALRENDPVEYSQIREIARQFEAGAITQADSMTRIHAALMSAYQRKLPNAPDSIVQAQAHLVGEEYTALDSSPDICISYALGTKVVDLRQYFSSSLIAEDQEKMSEVLRATPLQNPNVASDEQIQRGVLPILNKIARENGVPLSRVAAALQVKTDQRFACHVFAALFQGVSELPTEQSAAITRGLLRAGQSA
jgi:hypothetical protein